jgi:Lon protease-like protein
MSELAENFTGVVRLFPLPNVVFFPHVILPLHIFEPRYCELLEDALAHDKLISMALLKPGWEKEYEGRPAIYDVVCIGRILTHARLPEGGYNLLLQGVQRARILEELPADFSYRRAHVELLSDDEPMQPSTARGERQTQLIDLFRQFLPHSHEFQQQIDQVLSRSLELGLLTDLVAYTIQLPVEIKQQLLGETNVDHRAEQLIELLTANLQHRSTNDDERSDFPPPFSLN